MAVGADGDDLAPLTDCDCIWDLDSAVNDESDISQSVVSTSAGDVDLARYFAPVDLVAMASEEEAVWLREIRKTPCIAYEANTWAEHAIFGRVLTLAHSEYKKCWDHLKRPTL